MILPRIEQWLATAFSSQLLETIEKRESGWVSIKRPRSKDEIARIVAEEEIIIGVRHEKLTRIITLDFDKKRSHVSEYLRTIEGTRKIFHLIERSEQCGCQVSMVRSSASGGLHLLIALPEAVPSWKAYWIGAELLHGAGMEEQSGQAEVFPSRLDYRDGGPKDWARSNGFRLPGQEGSALIVGKTSIEDQELIYKQLVCDLENTEICEAWEGLLDTAIAYKKSRSVQRYKNNVKTWAKKKINKACGVIWTSGGQSEENLRQITIWARKNSAAKTVEELASVIRTAAVQCKGFNQYASENTKKDLSGKPGDWAERWARSSLRNDRNEQIRETVKKTDKSRNEDLCKLSRAKLTRVWKQFKDASSWSKRKLAKAAGISFQTLQKHWDYWVQLASSQLHNTRSNNGGEAVMAGGAGGRRLDPGSGVVGSLNYFWLDEVGYIKLPSSITETIKRLRSKPRKEGFEVSAEGSG